MKRFGRGTQHCDCIRDMPLLGVVGNRGTRKEGKHTTQKGGSVGPPRRNKGTTKKTKSHAKKVKKTGKNQMVLRGMPRRRTRCKRGVCEGGRPDRETHCDRQTEEKAEGGKEERKL